MKQKNLLDNLASIDTSSISDASDISDDNDVSYLLDEFISSAPGKTTENNPEEKTIAVSMGLKDDTSLSIDKLVPFRDHPFHVNTEEESFKQLMESIEEQGVIYPIVVRPIKGESEQYEILAGHCRVEACKQLGIEKIPARIIDADDLLATIIMTHTNITGRNKIALSEKAKAYKMCIDLEKHQGKAGLDTAALAGGNVDSRRQVYRFARLANLISEFLELLDRGRISIQVAYELSFISETGQKAILKFYQEFKQLPTFDEAQVLRVSDDDKNLSYTTVISILAKPAEKKRARNVSFKTKDIASYFSEDTAPEEMSDIIIKLLEKYKTGEVVL